MDRELSELNPAVMVFVLAFVVRVGGVAITAVTDINPDHGSDTVGFANVAAAIAAGERPFLDAITSIGSTYPTWGAMLTPFWLLPGPSEVYAQLFAAALGAYAVYNVFLIGRFYHSARAGVLASAPLLLFPSFVAIHSTILRDVAILFALTLAARWILVPGRWGWLLQYIGASAAILFATALRIENGPIYGLVLATGLIIYLIQRHQVFVVLPFTLVPVVHEVYHTYLLAPFSRSIYRGFGNLVDFLVFLREARIREQKRGARTGYLIDVVPQTVSEMLAFAPVGGFYFLFVPFPWMIETGIDLLTGLESLIALGYAVCAIGGLWYVGKRHPPVMLGLLVGVVGFATFYGLISVNVGTSVRQRQQIIWVVYLLGGIGMAAWFEPTLNTVGDRVRSVTGRVRPMVP